MRYAVAAAALVALATANPVPQDFSWADIDAAAPIPTVSIPVVDITATTVAYNAAAASETIAAEVLADSVNKRDAVKRDGTCAAQPAGAGLRTIPDTPDAFTKNPLYALAADLAPTPHGYERTFSDLKASNNAFGYMGYTTLNSYDVLGCSKKCDAINGCAAFNVYFERDPSLDPNASTCPNPPSTVNIKCVFWGGPVTAANAVNDGQWRDSFHVVIAGSNGYVNKSIEAPHGYTGPTYLGNAAINAPNDCNGANTYMGVKIFTDGPFDASKCAAACTAQSEYNLAHPPSDGPAQTCQFFNTYILLDNGNNVGQYCSLYNETWSSTYATNTGQYRGSDYYSIEYSYTFSNTTNPGTCTPASS